MVKKEKKTKKNIVKKDKQFWMSMIILILMITSIAGFALMMTVGAPKSDNSGQNIPKDYPLQPVEYQGQTFWVVIKNYEQFVFEEIDSFQNDSKSEEIANQIKQKNNLNLYIDSSSDQSAVYLLEKLLKSLNINYNYINESSCSSNDLYISTKPVQGDCIKFVYDNPIQYQKANSVVYHALK